jgi:hypothetical protein
MCPDRKRIPVLRIDTLLSNTLVEGTFCRVNEGDFDMASRKKIQAETAPENPEIIQAAIAEGRTLIEQGKSKIDAAMAIFRLLETMPQETIVSAFIEGATLTEKGALTYWYNCRRRMARERRDNPS